MHKINVSSSKSVDSSSRGICEHTEVYKMWSHTQSIYNCTRSDVTAIYHYCIPSWTTLDCFDSDVRCMINTTAYCVLRHTYSVWLLRKLSKYNSTLCAGSVLDVCMSHLCKGTCYALWTLAWCCIRCLGVLTECMYIHTSSTKGVLKRVSGWGNGNVNTIYSASCKLESSISHTNNQYLHCYSDDIRDNTYAAKAPMQSTSCRITASLLNT
jgi:hypothetical protein